MTIVNFQQELLEIKEELGGLTSSVSHIYEEVKELKTSTKALEETLARYQGILVGVASVFSIPWLWDKIATMSG